MSSTKPEVKGEPEAISFSEFLENVPPNQTYIIKDITLPQESFEPFYLKRPQISLHCDNQHCNGTRFFRCITSKSSINNDDNLYYLKYVCSNCQTNYKTFSISAKKTSSKLTGESFKFGEFPAFGPPTPSKLMKLVGSDREIFLKGRRCENQGLGIGAFIYYRRVVEHQKDRILKEIIKVSEKLNAPKEKIDSLNIALKETQFTKALNLAKDSIPESLLINGHNPLKLLHSALSEGVHAQTDEDCLEIASSVRIVLAELSERLAQALKDEVELTNALARLMQKK